MTYTAEQLAEVLKKHQAFVNGEDGGECANLEGADLQGADFCCAVLIGAKLSRTNLRGANLSGADLSCCDLSDSNLRGANLSGGLLYGANLRSANLRAAFLDGAALESADLCFASLNYANLSGASLAGADLRWTSLMGANLSDIRSLSGAVGNMVQIKSVYCDRWSVNYTTEHMQIGCQFHRIDQWWGFSDAEISKMASDALSWWKVWKPILKNIIEASPAVPGVRPE